MKTKLLTGIFGLLIASSTMFAGWGVGFGAGYYGLPAVAYVGPVHGYYHHRSGPYVNGYIAPAPYVAPYVAPMPYGEGYVGAPPFVGAIWFPGRWVYGAYGRHWARGYWGHRR